MSPAVARAARGPGRPATARRRPTTAAQTRWIAACIAAGVVAALGVVAMRNDLLRVQYGLARALEETRSLERERNAALARVREQRDPARLAQLARERGFVRPERIVDLPALPPAPVAREAR